MPVLDDNFSYLLIDEMGVTAAVDPAEPAKVRCLRYHTPYDSIIACSALQDHYTEHTLLYTIRATRYLLLHTRW